MINEISEPRSSRPKKTRLKGDASSMLWKEFQELERQKRIQLIQEMIPIGLMAVSEELQKEVRELLSESTKGLKKFGTNPGTVRLGDQILPIRVPRLRNENGEVAL